LNRSIQSSKLPILAIAMSHILLKA